MSFKKVYFGTNLKMYKGVADTVSYLKELEQLTSDIDRNCAELFFLLTLHFLKRYAPSARRKSF